MTDWKYELREAAIVLLTVLLLIFFVNDFTISTAIFAIAIGFCVYDAMSRKKLELKLQWHWAILSAISGGVLYTIREIAFTFLAVYFLMRFFLSLIRCGESKEILQRVDEMREAYETEIDNLRKSAEENLDTVINEIEMKYLQENLVLRAEYQELFDKLRALFDDSLKTQTDNIETSYKAKIEELKKNVPKMIEEELRQKFGEEKDQALSELRQKYETKLSDLTHRLEVAESEVEQKRKEIEDLKTRHIAELERLKEEFAAESRAAISKLEENSVYQLADYQRKLSEVRQRLEQNYKNHLKELELSYQKKNLELEKILIENQKTLEEELANFENEKNREIADIRENHQRQIDNLNDRLNSQDEYIQGLEKVNPRQSNQIFANKELHKLLQQTLRKAKYEVDIMSPWINRTITGRLETQIEKMLIRGVVLKIAYGIDDNSYDSSGFRSDKVDDLIRELVDKFGRYRNFRVKKVNSHGKLFICDDEYYVLTSMNPLSNDGKAWEEIGEKSYDKNNLEHYRRKYFDF